MRTGGYLSVGLLLLALSPSLARGAVVGSKHDLSSLGGEPCGYCHSVHNSIGGLGRPSYMGPLPDVTAVYNSPSFDHDAQLTTDTANQSDAPLCLTCHDGATISQIDIDQGTNIAPRIVGTDNDLTLDLSDDHPTGFVYNAALDPGALRPEPLLQYAKVGFGPGKNEMWCSSCHNVHGGAPGTPFLHTSNEASRLCLDCHIK